MRVVRTWLPAGQWIGRGRQVFHRICSDGSNITNLKWNRACGYSGVYGAGEGVAWWKQGRHLEYLEPHRAFLAGTIKAFFDFATV